MIYVCGCIISSILCLTVCLDDIIIDNYNQLKNEYNLKFTKNGKPNKNIIFLSFIVFLLKVSVYTLFSWITIFLYYKNRK